LDKAVQIAAPAVAGDAMVVPLLNGIDQVARLRRVYGSVVIPGAIRVESERVGPGHVVQTSPFAVLELAPPRDLWDRASALAGELQAAGLRCTLRASEAEVLWGKLAVLAPLALATSSLQQPLVACAGTRPRAASCCRRHERCAL